MAETETARPRKSILMLVALQALILIGVLLGAGTLLFNRLAQYDPGAPPTPTPVDADSNLAALVGVIGSSGGSGLSANLVETHTSTSTATPSITPSPTATPNPTGTFTPLPTLLPTPTPRPRPTGVVWIPISNCGTLSSPGHYRLTRDLVADSDCIQIQANNVNLDCNNAAITSTAFRGYGIVVRKLGFVLTSNPANVEIQNCRVSGFRYGIYVQGARDIYIHHNNASRNYNDVDSSNFGIFLGMVEGGGIRVNDAQGGRVEDNVTTDQAIGIDIRGAEGMAVRRNQSSQNSAWGINLVQTRNSEISQNTTADNLRRCVWGKGTVGAGCDAGGIVLQNGSSDNKVLSNTVSGKNGNGIFIKAHAVPCGDNNVIAGNYIADVLYNAIELSFCTGNQIVDNQITNGLDGIWLGFAANNAVRNNVIADMRNHGIISANSQNNQITGNRITNSNEALYFYGFDYDRAEFGFLPKPREYYLSRANCLCDNTLMNNGAAGVHLKNSTNNQVTGNTFANNGRNVWLQEDTSGNIIENNVGAWHPPSAPWFDLRACAWVW